MRTQTILVFTGRWSSFDLIHIHSAVLQNWGTNKLVPWLAAKSLYFLEPMGCSQRKKPPFMVDSDICSYDFHGSLNVPIKHYPTIGYMVYNGYYKVMSNIPKMGLLHQPLIFPMKTSISAGVFDAPEFITFVSASRHVPSMEKATSCAGAWRQRNMPKTRSIPSGKLT